MTGKQAQLVVARISEEERREHGQRQKRPKLRYLFILQA